MVHNGSQSSGGPVKMKHVLKTIINLLGPIISKNEFVMCNGVMIRNFRNNDTLRL